MTEDGPLPSRATQSERAVLAGLALVLTIGATVALTRDGKGSSVRVADSPSPVATAASPTPTLSPTPAASRSSAPRSSPRQHVPTRWFGYVTTSDGKPVVGAWVVTLSERTDADLRTDRSGRFTDDESRRYHHDVLFTVVMPETSAPARGEGTPEAGWRILDCGVVDCGHGGRVVLPAAAHVTGQVVDQSGGPAAGVKVVACTEDIPAPAINALGGSCFAAITRDDGTYLVGGLGPSRYSIRIAADYGPCQDPGYPNDTTTVVADLAAGETVTADFDVECGSQSP